MVETTTWDELSFLDLDNEIEPELKPREKSRKRKWREIELVKEKQRMKRELSEYEHWV